MANPAVKTVIETVRKLRELKDNGLAKEVVQDLLNHLEKLPITKDYPVKGCKGFVLIGSEWTPVNVLNENPNKKGWIEFRVHEPDGITVAEGVSFAPMWAHVNADNYPSIMIEDVFGTDE